MANAIQVQKIGPTKSANLDYVDDSTLKGKSFVAWVAAANGLPRQVTFHRPIGVTRLSEQEWVCTPTSEVGLLLERKSSEAVSRWEREMALAIKQETLAARTGRRMSEGPTPHEEWAFDGSPACGAHIKVLQDACRANKRNEAEWLQTASPEIQLAEARWKQALRADEARQRYIAAGHPRPAYETRGGPAGDRPQLRVEYLSTLSLSAAKDKVLARIMGSAPVAADADASDDEEE
jgi:hypothetical protein